MAFDLERVRSIVERVASSSGLEVLETDKILKSKLWVCLKRMFGV